MNETSILTDLRKKVCDAVDIERHGEDRFVIFCPFMFDDGDHFVVILNREDDRWILTDEGHTFMHMEYSGVDFSTPTRARVIESALTNHRIERRNGELRLNITEDQFGDGLFSFRDCLALQMLPQSLAKLPMNHSWTTSGY